MGSNMLRTTIIPLLLMLLSPPAVLFVWVAATVYNGDVLAALSDGGLRGPLWSAFPVPTVIAARLAVAFLIAQMILLVALPGKVFYAVPTPMGNRPRYKLNGTLSLLVTHVALLSMHCAGFVDLTQLYTHFGSLLAFLAAFALPCTFLLYVKGLVTPTNSDSGATEHGFVWDLWHGTELHPEIAGVSLKQLVNCRFAMMGWSVIVVSFVFAQYHILGYVANSMAVSVVLQLLYIYKFFYWEDGYFNSIDVIHDRFGFYIFWGCSALLPSIYTLTALYLVEHPVRLHPAAAMLIFSTGLFALWANYDTDRQRQYVRASDGRATVWGAKPRLVRASYVTGDGKTRKSFLLASGWWGIARHLNYVWEITLALSWCLPSGTQSILGYVYVIFLTVLLVDRAYRDEIRCKEKYGAAYDEYCRLVPYKMLPHVY